MMMSSDDTSWTLSTSSSLNSLEDQEQQQHQQHLEAASSHNHGGGGRRRRLCGNPVAFPSSSVTPVRTAARRMRLAFRSARTNAAAKKTWSQYSNNSNDADQHHNNDNQRSNHTTAFSSRSSRKHDEENHHHLSVGVICRTIDEALFSLYEDPPPEVAMRLEEDEDQQVTTTTTQQQQQQQPPHSSSRSEVRCQYGSASFQFATEYDSLLDDEHPYSEQDMKDAQYWMEQWQPSSSIEEMVTQLLQQPKHRPLYYSNDNDNNMATDNKNPDSESNHLTAPTKKDRDEEKKDDTNAIGNIIIRNNNMQKEEHEEDDDDFGDFQSAYTSAVPVTMSPTTTAAELDETTTSPRWMVIIESSIEETTIHGGDIFHTPRQQLSSLLDSRTPSLSPPANNHNTSSSSNIRLDNKSDNTECLIAQADAILRRKSSYDHDNDSHHHDNQNDPTTPSSDRLTLDTRNLKTPELLSLSRRFIKAQQDFPPSSSPPPTASSSLPLDTVSTTKSQHSEPTTTKTTTPDPHHTTTTHTTLSSLVEPPPPPRFLGHSPSSAFSLGRSAESMDQQQHLPSQLTTTITTTPITPKASVLLPLPVEELTTLEGRWTRRCQMEHEQQQQNKSTTQITAESLKNLPTRDETIQVLNSLPWEYLAGLEDHDSLAAVGNEQLLVSSFQSELELWDQVMMDRLCKYDSLLESVQREMTQCVNPEQVSQANELCHVLDTNLRVALKYHEQAMACLARAMNGGGGDNNNIDDNDGVALNGQALMLELWQAKEDYQQLDAYLAKLQSMLEIEQEIVQRIDTFDAQQTSAMEEYRKVRALADQVNQIASQPDLTAMSCLVETRNRLATLEDRFWNRLHQQLTNLVTRVCRRQRQRSLTAGGGTTPRSSSSSNAKMKALQKQQSQTEETNNTIHRTDFERVIKLQKHHNTDWTEYERIIQAALDLKNVSVVGDTAFATHWTQTIVQALSFEALRCFAVALLDPQVEDKDNHESNSTSRSSSSRFDSDLAKLSLEIQDWGDLSKLRQTCHNLVTIRFDFEASEFYFPQVYQRLCDGLINILRMATDFVEFHQHSSSSTAGDDGEDAGNHARLVALSQALNASLGLLWSQCENVLVQCLDEYLNFAAKRELFSKSSDSKNNNNEVDESAWLEDLLGLETVLVATENFLSYKSWLLDGANTVVTLISLLESKGSESALISRLSKLCQAHLRAVHMAAMTTTGKLLSQESWVLTCLKTPQGNVIEGDSGVDVLRKALESRLANYESFFSRSAAASSVGKTCYDGPNSANEECPMIHSQGEDCISAGKVREFMDYFLTDKKDDPQRVVPSCVADNLLHWLSRLILIGEKLPLVAGNIVDVVTNLFDLYTMTVLRLCSGNIKNERILIGAERPSPPRVMFDHGRRHHHRSPIQKKRPSSPGIFFGKERRQHRNNSRNNNNNTPLQTRIQILTPPLREVDICAPLLKDEAEFFRLRKFVARAQESLSGIVNLDRVDTWLTDPPLEETGGETLEMVCSACRILEKRVAAAWSCFALACLGEMTFVLALSKVSNKHGAAAAEKLDSLNEYFRSVTLITAPLVEAAILFSCVKTIGGARIVTSIIKVGPKWEECKLHELPNEYVDDLCDRCSLVWGFVAASGKLSGKIMERCWVKVADAAYLCMLEGFSRVPFCSTEGRALMALDLASFSVGIQAHALANRLEKHNLPCTIPSVTARHGMRNVDIYIKVFYYPWEEIVKWVKDNYRDYKISHSFALVAKNFTESYCSDHMLQKVIEDLKLLYQYEIMTAE